MYRARYGNPDRNQQPLVKLARRIGAKIAITTGVGNGFGDLVGGIDGRLKMAEIKNGSKLRTKQEDNIREWQAVGVTVSVIETGPQMLRWLMNAPQPPPRFGKAPVRRIIVEYEDGHREILLPDGDKEPRPDGRPDHDDIDE